MADDWIKVEKGTADKPEVLGIARILKITRDDAFGKCVRFWSWADSHLRDCNAENVTFALLDCVIGCDGFASAMARVGWLIEGENSVVIPNFDRHMGLSAKRRADTLRRVRAHRDKSDCNENVTQKTLQKRYQSESESKNSNTPLTPQRGEPLVRPYSRKSKRPPKPDPLEDSELARKVNGEK